jgi:two-component system sensor histidine kinase/response regulator
MPETKTGTPEVQQLRRCIRDLVALSAFPAVWVGYDACRIAESLVDVLRHTLHLDLIYLAVREGADGIAVEVAQTTQGPAPADRAQEVGRALDPWLRLGSSGMPSSIPDPLGSGTIPIVLTRFRMGASRGVLVASSRRADFPTEVDRLLLSFGANQAAILLERWRAEQALRESEERFRGTFENAAVGIVHVDLQGRFLRVNERFCDIIGYTREELLKKTFRDITHPDDLDISLEHFLPLSRGELPGFSLEKRYLGKDGTVVWMSLDSSLQRDAAGALAYVISVLQDISGRKRLEEELNQAHARLELAVRGSNVGVWELEIPDGDPRHGRRHHVNVWEQLGYEGLPAGRESALDVAHPDDRAHAEDAMRRYLAGEAAEFETEIRFCHREGSYRTMLARGAAVRDAAGRPIRFVGIAIDITRLRLAEEALRASEARFRALVQDSSDIISLFDAEGTIVYQSPSVERLLGYRPQDRIGRNVFSDPLVHPDDRDAKRAFFDTARSRPGAPVTVEFRLRHADGSWRDIEAIGQNFLHDPAVAGIVATYRDVTERKRAEEALRASERRFRTLARATNDAVWDWDLGTNKVWWNEGVISLFGYRLENNEADPAWWLERIHPEDRTAVEAFFFDVVRGTDLSWVDEYRFRCADGSYKDVYDRGYVLRDADGQATRMIGSMLDITARKRAEEALRLANARLDLALRGSNIVIVELNMPDGVLENGRWEWVSAEDQISGHDRSDLATDFAATMPRVHPDDRERVLGALQAHLSGQTREFEAEGRIRHKDGSYIWRLARGVAVRDAEGRAIRFMMSAVDITALKRAEEALRESEQRFRTLAETLPTMVWTAEPDGTIDYINSRTIEYTGLTLEQLRGRDQGSTLHPEDMTRCIEQWTRSVATGELYEIEYRKRRADGAFRWHLARALPLHDESGRITKWFGSIIDIDDQKRAEEALRRAKEAAEAASRAKDEFLANVSHEIRTPMNAILGMTELALDTPLTGEQREYLAIVKSSAEALLKVINDLLDFAKIEAGKLELDHADFSLRRVLGETLRALAFRAHRKGLELACWIPPEVPDALIGDAGRLRQVLLNLIGNAVKFTEHGEVVVRVEAGVEHTPTEPDPSVPGSRPSQVLHFSISDTGIGIPREKQEKIFQAFEQVDSSRTRRYEGTGLGLSIAARLVALMGGQITVESEPGRGSTFRFTAEFGLQPHPPSGPPERPLVDLHGLRVLVVDDNATNRQILEEWLRGWHTEPLAVADGFKALDALWSAVSFGRPFALVLLDARMPGTDGLAVAQSILQNPVLSQCRIIMLTSEDLHGDLARYRELGIAAYVMKPVQPEELLEIIYRVLSRPNPADVVVDRMGLIAAADSTAATTATSARRLRVLVAEDNPFNQQLVELLLRRQGHDIRVVSDGREALAVLEQDRFDLMLLDVHMPGCDGFQVIEALRRREQATGGHLPVIALTARAMKSDRERCLQAGMDDYLAKPIAAAELVRVMDRVLAGRPAAEPVPPGRGRSETLLDPATLLAVCDDDPTLLRELIRGFQADTSGALARVRDAVDQQDASRLREAAHALRGLLSTFSAIAAAEAARLETMGDSGQLDEAASTLDGLTEMVVRLGPQLEELSIEQLRHQAARPGIAG